MRNKVFLDKTQESVRPPQGLQGLSSQADQTQPVVECFKADYWYGSSVGF